MTTTIKTASGRTRALPDHVDESEVIGLDEAGRIVVQLDWMDEPFGLTLCCDAFDKGVEDGVVCRACFGAKSGDTGNYLFFKDGAGEWLGLDRRVT